MAQQKDSGSSNLTLTVFMDASRKFLVVGGVCLVLLMIFQFGLTIYQNIKAQRDSYVAELPTMGYSYLPPINFPRSSVLYPPTNYILSYRGSSDPRDLPQFGSDNNMRIYKIASSPYSLLADRRARELAATYGFTGEPQALDNQTYRFFTSDGMLDQQLQIDLQTFAFSLTSNYLTNPDFLKGAGNSKQLPNRTMAAGDVRGFLSMAGVLPADLVDAQTEVNYVKAVGDRVELVDTFYEADFLSVNLPRAPLEGNYSFFGPNKRSSIFAIVARDTLGNDYIVHLDYFYHQINAADSQTYPLRSTASAFEVLQSGGAYIASMGNNSQVVIDNVQVGYYEDPNGGDYLQPIFIFSSSDGFAAYVQAVDQRAVGR